jgi:MFS family permease
MLVMGFGVILSVIASTSLRQRVVPGEMLGRVTAGYRVFVSGAMALGALAGGLIGEFTGVRRALVVSVAIYLCVAFAAFWTSLNEPDSPGAAGVAPALR